MKIFHSGGCSTGDSYPRIHMDRRLDIMTSFFYLKKSRSDHRRFLERNRAKKSGKWEKVF